MGDEARRPHLPLLATNIRSYRGGTMNVAAKLRGYVEWLWSRPEFREHPARMLWRATQWQAKTAFRREVAVSFDSTLRICSPKRNASASTTFYLGFVEPRFLRFLSAWLRPGMNVIDVGANVGAYTLLAAKRVAPYGRVLAFEAAPQTHRFLVENIRRNGFSNVRAELLALGDVPGLLTFTERSDFGKSSVCVNNEVCGTIQVHAIALDSYCTSVSPTPIDYLKIDVEGYELAVLRGARKTLARNPAMLVQMEMIESHARRFGFELASVQWLMGEYGFSPYALSESGRALTKLDTIVGHFGDVLWMTPEGRHRIVAVAEIV
jgi:FkbM family methyltransferase